jgi:hypothetical protein
MPIEMVDIFARENVETEVGRVHKRGITARETRNSFNFAGEIGAFVPVDQADSIIKVAFEGGIGWKVIGKPVRARLSWEYTLALPNTPSESGQSSMTYSLEYKAFSNEFGPITGRLIQNATIRPITERDAPIFDLKPASSYSMTAWLTMECRVPEQKGNVNVAAWLTGAIWKLEEV